jgi:hypothetical protein
MKKIVTVFEVSINRAWGAIAFPCFFIIIGFISVYIFSDSYQDYIDRVHHNDGLLFKYYFGAFTGFIALIIWCVNIIPKAIIAILSVDAVILQQDSVIIKNRAFYYRDIDHVQIYVKFLDQGFSIYLKDSSKVNLSLPFLSEKFEVVEGAINDHLRDFR